MKFRDQLSGLFWLGISILICAESTRVTVGTLRTPGPGFLPFWIGVFLGIFAIILVITKTLKGEKGKIRSLWEGKNWRKVVLVVISLVTYCILITKIGYLITTFGLMTALFGIMRGQRIWIRMVIALIIVLTSYYFFHVWLNLPLPRGLLSF